jgi:hypothetical protein
VAGGHDETDDKGNAPEGHEHAKNVIFQGFRGIVTQEPRLLLSSEKRCYFTLPTAVDPEVRGGEQTRRDSDVIPRTGSTAGCRDRHRVTNLEPLREQLEGAAFGDGAIGLVRAPNLS